MQNFLQRDLGSSLLSIAVILGWLGLFIVFMRILTISIKRILEAYLKILIIKINHSFIFSHKI